MNNYLIHKTIAQTFDSLFTLSEEVHDQWFAKLHHNDHAILELWDEQTLKEMQADVLNLTIYNWSLVPA